MILSLKICCMKKITRCQKRSFQVVLLDLTVISCNILTFYWFGGDRIENLTS
jgi:hypothetical protein